MATGRSCPHMHRHACARWLTTPILSLKLPWRKQASKKTINILTQCSATATQYRLPLIVCELDWSPFTNSRLNYKRMELLQLNINRISSCISWGITVPFYSFDVIAQIQSSSASPRRIPRRELYQRDILENNTPIQRQEDTRPNCFDKIHLIVSCTLILLSHERMAIPFPSSIPGCAMDPSTSHADRIVHTPSNKHTVSCFLRYS